MSQASRRSINTVFHADLSDAHPGEDYWVSVSGRRVPLVPHTAETLAAAVKGAPHLTAAHPKPTLTHYSKEPIGMPHDRVLRVHLRHTQRNIPNAIGETGVGHVALAIPPVGHALQTMGAGDVNAVRIDWLSTAQTFLFHHPGLINNDPNLTTLICSTYMVNDAEIAADINNLASLMRQMGAPSATGWSTLSAFTPESYPTVPPTDPPYTPPATVNQMIPSDQVVAQSTAPMTKLILRVQNVPEFQTKKWTVTPGTSVTSATAPGPQLMGADVEHAAMIQTTAAVGGDNWTAAVANSGFMGFSTSITVADASKQQINISMSNNYLRYLAAYIQFYDANGNPLRVPSWKPDSSDSCGGLADFLAPVLPLQGDTVRYMGLLDPMDCFLGIPTGNAGALNATVTFPPNAVSASVYGSGLGMSGSDPWPYTPIVGGTLTGIINIGVPTLMLGMDGAMMTFGPAYKAITEVMNSAAAKVVAIAALLGLITKIIVVSANNHKVDWSGITSLGNLIFSPLLEKVLLLVMGTAALEEVVDQIPFAGWVAAAVNCAVDVAQLTQTLVETGTSDLNIENKVSSTITSNVTVHPDPRNKAFPQGTGRQLIVNMVYKGQKQPTQQSVTPVADGSIALTFPATFPNNTLGGQIKFEANFYVGSWLAGKATTGWIPNDVNDAANVTMYLVEFPVPLSATSVYTHSQLLTWTNGAYGWTVTSTAPTATITSRDTSPTGNAIGNWEGLALSQRTGILGPAWEAAGMGIADCATGSTGQLYAFINLNIPGTPMTDVQFPSCGFVGQSRLVYDPYPPKFLMKDGSWVIGSNNQPVPDPTDVSLGNYYVDPRSANLPVEQGGGYHLRAVTLNPSTPFNMAAGQTSFGRFRYFPDAVCLHPSGHAIGVNAQYKVLQIVKLESEGIADTDVLIGSVAAGPASDPTRPGLLFHPVAVNCAYDGTIIVLEDTKFSTGTVTTTVSRLAAYDMNLNPVNRFNDAQGAPSQWLYLADPADNYYLDIAVVGDNQMTYIYVLYYTGAGDSPSDYNMSIYTYGGSAPSANPLVTTNGIAAANLAVDMWHTAYVLNFPMVTDGAGHAAGPTNASTGPAGRTVPSVSMWLPPVP